MNEMMRIARERDADFHTNEWGLLYAEIGENFRLAFQIAVYALIANGFIMAWVAQSGKDVFSPLVIQIAALIPILLTIFAFALYRFLLWRSSIIYEYLFSIENSVAADGLGWENFYRKLCSQGRTRTGSRGIFYALFLIQAALGGAFAFIVFRKYS
ncbi:MAG: hypothetical protein HY765_02565 [Rhodomicrobium sp.]|nr:hypothetical protein [Rhodomicrobium sp.]